MTSNKKSSIKTRKAEHVDIVSTKNVQANTISTGFKDVHLIHKSLPEINLNDVKIETTFLGKKFNTPFIIDGMTGGYDGAFKINEALGIAAEKFGIGIGTGSQRVALKNPNVSDSFKIVRKKAPNAFIMGNIGVQQLKGKDGVKIIEKCIDMIDANAMAIHLNPLQEAVQNEGDPEYRDCLKSIEKIVNSISIPIIIKETGAGISGHIAKQLQEVGVSAINVSGAGGTSWAAVEHYRNINAKNLMMADIAKTFWDWGIPTAACVYQVSKMVNIPVIASGGIRNGLEIAKSIALGAKMTATAFPLLLSALKGNQNVNDNLKKLIHEIKISMFLTGSKNLIELSNADYVIKTDALLHQYILKTNNRKLKAGIAELWY